MDDGLGRQAGVGGLTGTIVVVRTSIDRQGEVHRSHRHGG
jgi:hypothetical protein